MSDVLIADSDTRVFNFEDICWDQRFSEKNCTDKLGTEWIYCRKYQKRDTDQISMTRGARSEASAVSK